MIVKVNEWIDLHETEILTLWEKAQKGEKIDIPKHYFKDDNPDNPPVVTWRSHSNLLFSNWLNYYVYQETPYDVEKIKPQENEEETK